MGIFEPSHTQGRSLKIIFTLSICSAITSISSAYASTQWTGIEVPKRLENIFSSATGWHSSGFTHDLNTLLQKAQTAVANNIASRHSGGFQGFLSGRGLENFQAKRFVGDQDTGTVKFSQTYQGVEVIGNEALVHFNRDGEVHDIDGQALTASVDVRPSLSLTDAMRILRDRYHQNVNLSEAAKLKVFKNFDGSVHLVYEMLTRTTATHAGQDVLVDAHNGGVVLETDRAYDLSTVDRGKRSVYTANTPKARQHVDGQGYPSDIDLSWYAKVIDDDQKDRERLDRSINNAYRNSGRVYSYYKSVHKRASYDDHDARLVSVVHMGDKMNNAFWTDEFKIMAYGDGDGEHLNDLTYGLDVAAHELTHAVTASTARLVYAAESGALNESYSDFFGKMVDYTEGNWDIAARVMPQNGRRRALRNMKNPEEFKQPGSNDSALRRSTTGSCTSANDRCGVHTNSGIPNRAAALIVDAIGKETAEKIYYKVLSERLTATSNFSDARRATEKECERMFEATGGANSKECVEVTKAFDTVKM